MASILLTRPLADSNMLAQALSTHGVASMVHPLSEVVQLDAAPLAIQPAAIVLTSRHAAYALPVDVDVPVFAIGEATAEAAESRGFQAIHAAGDFNALIAMIMQRVPVGADIAYFRGANVRHSLAESLPHHRVHERIVYALNAMDSLDDACFSCSGVALFSVGSAERFVHASNHRHHRMTAYCFSADIAESLQGKGFARYVISASQTVQAMVDCIVHDLKR